MQELITLQEYNNKPVVSTLQVAEHFEKQHKHVLDSVNQILSSAENSAQLFILSTYKDSINRTLPMYLLTRDGFSLLVMGFTGDKALQWKLKYIEAFNKMEQKLTKPMSQLEILLAQTQALIDMDSKVNALETKQLAQDNKIEKVLEVFTKTNDRAWRDDINHKINAMVLESGLPFQKFKGELYTELERTAGCNLTTRRTNLIKRMTGATYKEKQAVTKLEVIERDNKLKAIFEGIVRKYQAKYAKGA